MNLGNKTTYVKTAGMSAAVIFSVLAFAVGGVSSYNIASASSSEEEEQHQKEIAPRSQIDIESCHIEVEVPEGEVEPASTELVEREEVEPATTKVVEKNAENDAKAEVVIAEEPAATQDGSLGGGEIERVEEPCGE